MRDDLEQKVRSRKRSFDLRQISFAVLVAHRAGRDAKRPIIQGSDKRVDLGSQRRLCQLFGKAPEFTAAGDRPLVVQEHAVGVAAPAATEGYGDHLTALRVVAETVRVWNADEFVFHQRL